MPQPKQRYSAFTLARNALTGHKHWDKVWRSPEPKEHYDVVVVGAGGHGLGTAYYLAKEHGVGNVAVLEKGWLGGGNTGRNTTIIRSNYLYDESAALYDHAVKLWETLSQELNYNQMFSQRGVFNTCHTEAEVRTTKRRVHANRLNGIDSVFMTPAEIKQYAPYINTDPNARLPLMGASFQYRAGVSRHDAVAWGYARKADELGVDIIQNCEVQGIQRDSQNRVTGLDTNRGHIRANKVALVASGNSSRLAEMAGFRLPIESFPLQALVSEPVKPKLDTVIMGGGVHGYISQSDKGELVIGAGTDQYVSYSQRGAITINEHTLEAIVELFPIFSRMRMLRQWGGVVDVTPDRSPIIGKTPVGNLFINCGWGTGGFKATPGSAHTFAATVAQGEPHWMNREFALERFGRGYIVDESGAAAVAH